MSAAHKAAARALAKEIRAMRMELEEVTRRARNIVRPAFVKKLHADENRIVAQSGELETDKISWVQLAGGAEGFNLFAPPSEGTTGYIISPSGDPSHAFFVPTSYHEGRDPADNRPGVFTLKHQDTTFTMTGDRVTISLGGSTIDMNGNGIELKRGGSTLTIMGAGNTFTNGLDIVGAVVTHDGKNIGKDHGHVTAPPGPPGPPV